MALNAMDLVNELLSIGLDITDEEVNELAKKYGFTKDYVLEVINDLDFVRRM